MQPTRKNPVPIILSKKLEFPAVENADAEGLLAIGGDLSPERLLLAYKNGIFPWSNEGAPLLWWSPDPRMVLFPHKIRISKSMQKILHGGSFRLTKNNCFESIIANCAVIKRVGQKGTWITGEMQEAYKTLNRNGHIISYAVWEDDTLVGGLYGVDLGDVFCGESMFSKVANASKYALIKIAQDLEKRKYRFIDCQMYTPHLESMGAETMQRTDFIKMLKSY